MNTTYIATTKGGHEVTLADADQLRDEMQRHGLRYSELAAHVVHAATVTRRDG